MPFSLFYRNAPGEYRKIFTDETYLKCFREQQRLVKKGEYKSHELFVSSLDYENKKDEQLVSKVN